MCQFILAMNFLVGGGGFSVRAACVVCSDFQQGAVAGSVSANALTEASGIAASGKNPGVIMDPQ